MVKKPIIGRKTGKAKTSRLSKEEQAAVSRENGKKKPEVRKNIAYEMSEPMNSEYDVADMMADIYDPRAKIAPEMKIHAAACYFLTGTVQGTARMTGFKHQTISEWKNKAQWWLPVLSKIKKDKNDELDADLTQLIHVTSTEILDRLKDGDSYVTSEYVVKTFGEGKEAKDKLVKQDVLKRKPVTARDLGALLNTIYDKRTMLRGDPTSITVKKDQTKLLDDLRASMRELAAEAMSNELKKTVVNTDGPQKD